MAQVQLNRKQTNDDEENVNVLNNENERRVKFQLDGIEHISVFKNKTGHVVINIRTGTRSISISEDTFNEIVNLKETILLSCAFVNMTDGSENR